MRQRDQLFEVEKDLGRKVVMALIVVLGLFSASLAGLCYYIMNDAGLLAFTGFLIFSAVVVGCAGAFLTYMREGKGLY